jgi:hypothetical protein
MKNYENKFYLINELANSVIVFNFDEEKIYLNKIK